MSDPVDTSAGADRQFVSFEVAGEMFAVPMAPVQEIIRVPEVARLPLAPRALEGLANLRGRVLPILNLRRLFGTDEAAHDDATRALVIQIGQPLGFVVDRVASVLSVEPGAVEPASAISSVVRSEHLTGVIRRPQPDGSTRLMLVVDFERLVQEQFAGTAGTDAAGRGARLDGGTPGEPAAAAGGDELRLVSFTVCGQEYAIDIASVREIVQVPERITAVPNTPHHVLGLISLRERLLPLVSLRSLFGLAPQAAGEHHRIVVVALPGGGQVGLVTDSVKEVLSVPRRQADEMPGVLARDAELQEFESICRLDEGRRLVSILATDRLLGLQALRDAAAIGGEANREESTMKHSADALARQGEEDLQAVIFRLGAEEFGVPIMSVQEIVRVPEGLTRVPKTPDFVEGVINLRGTVLPVIDQRKRLGLPALERQEGQRIMVYTLGGQRTGFIVDAVAEVLRIPQAAIEPAPALGEEQARLISRVAKLDGDRRLVMLIEPERLLGERESRAVGALDLEPPAPLARAA